MDVCNTLCDTWRKRIRLSNVSFLTHSMSRHRKHERVCRMKINLKWQTWTKRSEVVDGCMFLEKQTRPSSDSWSFASLFGPTINQMNRQLIKANLSKCKSLRKSGRPNSFFDPRHLIVFRKTCSHILLKSSFTSGFLCVDFNFGIFHVTD